jgi:hypothetical protein
MRREGRWLQRRATISYRVLVRKQATAIGAPEKTHEFFEDKLTTGFPTVR